MPNKIDLFTDIGIIRLTFLNIDLNAQFYEHLDIKHPTSLYREHSISIVLGKPNKAYALMAKTVISQKYTILPG